MNGYCDDMLIVDGVEVLAARRGRVGGPG